MWKGFETEIENQYDLYQYDNKNEIQFLKALVAVCFIICYVLMTAKTF